MLRIKLSVINCKSCVIYFLARNTLKIFVLKYFSFSKINTNILMEYRPLSKKLFTSYEKSFASNVIYIHLQNVYTWWREYLIFKPLLRDFNCIYFRIYIYIFMTHVIKRLATFNHGIPLRWSSHSSDSKFSA